MILWMNSFYLVVTYTKFPPPMHIYTYYIHRYVFNVAPRLIRFGKGFVLRVSNAVRRAKSPGSSAHQVEASRSFILPKLSPLASICCGFSTNSSKFVLFCGHSTPTQRGKGAKIRYRGDHQFDVFVYFPTFFSFFFNAESFDFLSIE